MQHDLQSDPPLVRTGDLFKLRKPIWEKGVANILFILSLRANDTLADEGVLPTKEQQQQLHITIISLKHAKHIDMYDKGPKSVRQQIIHLIISFLGNKTSRPFK